jgi:uncharacterized membrane protein (UPF0136 family)
MNTIPVCSLSILVFAILMLVGGIMGFKKAKSKPSLIAGCVSAAVFAGCYIFSLSNPLLAFKLAFVASGALEGIFLVRLIKTKKFMPSGLLLILSILEQLELYMTMAV